MVLGLGVEVAWLRHILVLLQATRQVEGALRNRNVFNHNSVPVQSWTCPLPVDDSHIPSSTTDSQIPWTHSPSCLRSELIPKEKLCVYTVSTFNQNKGISLISTPDTAASIVEALNDPGPAWNARKHLRGAEGSSPDDIVYEVKSIPGKGYGVVAAKDIKKGELIMEGFPALIIDNNAMSLTGVQRLFDNAASQLGDQIRLLNLSNTAEVEGDVIQNILKTNAFGMSLNGRRHKGLYPEIARINHACNPNAFTRLDDVADYSSEAARGSTGTLSTKAIALRNIGAGEEISISYIPVGLLSSQRSVTLSQGWGFDCTCTLCRAESRETLKSDHRRRRLREIDDIFQQGGRETDFPAILDLTAEFIDIIESEHLTAKASDYYVTLMNVYFEWGDLDRSIKYGQQALGDMIAFARSNELVREMKKHLDWMKSLRQTAGT